MFFADRIKLISVTTTTNDMGDIIEAETETEIFADKKSIRQSEFYQAAATGLRPEIMFEIWSNEYVSQSKIKYNDKTYTIIRTYNKGEITELICQGLVNN